MDQTSRAGLSETATLKLSRIDGKPETTSGRDNPALVERRWGSSSRMVLTGGAAFLALLFSFGVPLRAEGKSQVFAIPSSDLVFDVVVELASGDEVRIEAREGSFVLIDRTPADPENQIGFILTVDRALPVGRRAEGVILQTWTIGPSPDGGEKADFAAVHQLGYGSATEVNVGGERYVVRVDGHHFKDFSDARLVSALWRSVRRDPNSLDPVLSDLYALFGPRSQECKICWGSLVCGTEVSCGGWAH